MQILTGIQMTQAVTDGPGQTTWRSTGFVWKPNGDVVAQSPQQELADFPGGQAPAPIFVFNLAVPDGTTYYYGAIIDSIVSGPAYPQLGHPAGGEARIISNNNSTDNSMGHTAGSWLSMFDNGAPNQVVAQNFRLIFDTGTFNTQAGGSLTSGGTVIPSAEFKPFGAIYKTPGVAPPTFAANFEIDPDESGGILSTSRNITGLSPLKVKFLDTSLGKRGGDFFDWLKNLSGSPIQRIFSNEENPIHVFDARNPTKGGDIVKNINTNTV